MRLALAGAAAAAAALLSAPAAHASAVPYLHLKVSISGPHFGDATDKMYYNLTVANSADSQTTATGLKVKLTELACPAPTTPEALCRNQGTSWVPVPDIAPGGHVSEALEVELPNNQEEDWLRLTPEIATADELIRGDAPGTCVYGHHPSDLCAPTTYDLLP
jgi:hypothetical protein